MAEADSALPGGKLFSLLRESRWLLLIACALYFTVALYGYDRADPAWSHSASGALTGNPGGALGAYLSDLLFYLFGFSAWWWVLFMLQRVWAGYHELRSDSIFDRRTWWVSVAGFAVLLLASSALEAVRLYTLKAALPLVPGGMLGVLIGDTLTRLLGFTGATLLLLALIATGFSIFSGLSWLRFVDWLGALLDNAWQRARLAWQTWQDRRIGAQAMTERVAVVEKKKKRVEEHQPIHIEMPLMEVARSARVAEEKQVPLFAEMPDSPLPPLHLLDPSTQQVDAGSADTLEFTSRLIER
ncbi:MAG: DNA translocase FtsK 4TM domain-containing protein, partial [Nitrosomonadales bacterium]|nr:DNA translocase FtsK 4TM domain-containing protein [Nitrosomonadales bacterium]